MLIKLCEFVTVNRRKIQPKRLLSVAVLYALNLQKKSFVGLSAPGPAGGAYSSSKLLSWIKGGALWRRREGGKGRRGKKERKGISPNKNSGYGPVVGQGCVRNDKAAPAKESGTGRQRNHSNCHIRKIRLNSRTVNQRAVFWNCVHFLKIARNLATATSTWRGTHWRIFL